MNMEPFEREPFQRSRLGTLDIGAVGRGRHRITALLEVDVTEARRLLKGRPELSFNSWLLKCIGDCVAQYPELHGIRRGSGTSSVSGMWIWRSSSNGRWRGTAFPYPV